MPNLETTHVPPTPSIHQVAANSMHVTDEASRRYLQDRIALFARAMFLLFSGSIIMAALMRIFVAPFEHPPNMLGVLLGIVAVVGLGFLWLHLRGDLISARKVAWLDFACVGDPAALLALNAYVNRDLTMALFGTFVMLCLLVFGRALIVPSRGRRTFVVSMVASMPLIGAAALIEMEQATAMLIPGGTTAIIVVWCVSVAILAGYGSSVIYGLREEVREAKHLGQYTLLSKIGEGGMGKVYRAQHAMLRRPTAIKLLPPEKAGDKLLARFEREVQATSELNHPNTVHIYDYGRSPDGVFYYAMEFLDGVDLDGLVDRHGPQPVGRVIHILKQVCGALAEAHEHGLVHRDVKPGNIVLCHRGGIPDVIKVLDFGLVKELDRASSDASPHATDVNVVAGTPAFMAPEAITAPDLVGPKADLYALGAVAYFLLTGEPVFSGATIVEVCGHHVHSKPPPVSQRMQADVDGDLEHLIDRCLKKDPAERFSDARELAAALEELPEAKSWSVEDAERWWREVRESDAPVEPRKPVSAALTMDVDLSVRAT